LSIPSSEDSVQKPVAAMQGIRVIDCATFIAAPFASTLLGEFGAEVIKVELPDIGDPCRRLGNASEAGDSFTWLTEARNKKSVTLDLRKPEGAELFKRLVDPHSPNQLTDEGMRRMNAYASGGYDYLSEQRETKPYSGEEFLRDYAQLIEGAVAA